MESEDGAGAGEDGDEATEDGFLRIEAKTYSRISSDGYFRIKEAHGKGSREIVLSGRQLIWLCEVLREKKRFSEPSTGKISKRFEEGVVSVIEGSNHWGFFLAIQVKVRSSEPNFIIVPAGFQGRQWGVFALWLQICVPSDGTSCCRGTLNRDLGAPSSSRSYADMCKSGLGLEERVSNAMVSDLRGQLFILNGKLDAVLKILSALTVPTISTGECVQEGAVCKNGDGATAGRDEEGDACKDHGLINESVVSDVSREQMVSEGNSGVLNNCLNFVSSGASGSVLGDREKLGTAPFLTSLTEAFCGQNFEWVKDKDCARDSFVLEPNLGASDKSDNVSNGAVMVSSGSPNRRKFFTGLFKRKKNSWRRVFLKNQRLRETALLKAWMNLKSISVQENPKKDAISFPLVCPDALLVPLELRNEDMQCAETRVCVDRIVTGEYPVDTLKSKGASDTNTRDSEVEDANASKDSGAFEELGETDTSPTSFYFNSDSGKGEQFGSINDETSKGASSEEDFLMDADLKLDLQDEEEAISKMTLPTGLSMGERITFEGEPFFEFTIFRKLFPPAFVQDSSEYFICWRDEVGLPLLKCLKAEGYDFDERPFVENPLSWELFEDLGNSLCGILFRKGN